MVKTFGNQLSEITARQLWNWGASIVVGLSIAWTVLGTLVSYVVSASANDIFDTMLKDRGITTQSFQELQKDVGELKVDLGSIKSNVNSINNTLTLKAANDEEADIDREEIKKQMKKLVDKLIQE